MKINSDALKISKDEVKAEKMGLSWAMMMRCYHRSKRIRVTDLGLFKIPQYARVKRDDGDFEEYWTYRPQPIYGIPYDLFKIMGYVYGKFLELIGKWKNGNIEFIPVAMDFGSSCDGVKVFIEIEKQHVEPWLKCRDKLIQIYKDAGRWDDEINIPTGECNGVFSQSLASNSDNA